MKKALLFVGVLAALVLASLAVRNWTHRYPAPATVRIALTPYLGDLPFFVAVDKGFFAEEGLHVETTVFGDSTQALNALLAGRIDIVNPLSFSTLLAAETKAPGSLRLFLPGGEDERVVGSYLLIPKGSGLRTVADLRGKTVGTYTGASQLLYLKLFLSRVGLVPDRDVTIRQVGLNLQLQALLAGQYDALFTIEPTATTALVQNQVDILVSNPRVQYIVSPFISGSAAVASAVVRSRPQDVRSVLRGVDRALRYIRQDEPAARRILATAAHLDTEVANRVPLLVWYGSNDAIDYAPIQKLADLLAAERLVAKPLQVQPLFLDTADWKGLQ